MKKTVSQAKRIAEIKSMLENYVLGEGKAKLNAAQIKVALELLKLNEAEKKRAADARTRRKDSGKGDGTRDIEALLKELE